MPSILAVHIEMDTDTAHVANRVVDVAIERLCDFCDLERRAPIRKRNDYLKASFSFTCDEDVVSVAEKASTRLASGWSEVGRSWLVWNPGEQASTYDPVIRFISVEAFEEALPH